MEIFLDELKSGMPDLREFVRVFGRVFLAALLGAMVGIQRERAGKPAGVRTHMLVSMGCAMVVVACIEYGMGDDALSRVIQGVVTGIGFIGAGAILKLEKQHEIEGLTTAAGVWMTAAIGIAAGIGRLGAAILGAVLTLVVLSIVGGITHQLELKKGRKPASDD